MEPPSDVHRGLKPEAFDLFQDSSLVSSSRKPARQHHTHKSNWTYAQGSKTRPRPMDTSLLYNFETPETKEVLSALHRHSSNHTAGTANTMISTAKRLSPLTWKGMTGDEVTYTQRRQDLGISPGPVYGRSDAPGSRQRHIDYGDMHRPVERQPTRPIRFPTSARFEGFGSYWPPDTKKPKQRSRARS